MRRLIPVLAGAAIALAAAQAWAQAWIIRAFPESGVGAQFPGDPVAATGAYPAASGPLPQTVYAIDQDGARFSLTVADFSGHGGELGKAAKDAMATLRAEGQVKLDVEECINGQPGRELSVAGKDGGAVKASVFAVGSRLYVLEARLTAEAAAERSADAIRFQQSLRFAGGPLGRGDGILPECRGRAREASEISP